jgi:mRNA interferase RelE/StbE
MSSDPEHPNFRLIVERRAIKALQMMDRQHAAILVAWIDKNLSATANPRHVGEALSGGLAGLWRYRVGDYRILAEILDREILLLMLDVAHCGDAYKQWHAKYKNHGRHR